MKKYFGQFFIIIMLLSWISVHAQGMFGDGTGFMFPDTLKQVAITGKAIVDTTKGMPMAIYFLDENSDGKAEYHLNFGPYWYKPDNSTAARPRNGEQITIKGGLVNNSMYGVPMVVVSFIGGQFWRDPFDPTWNNFGDNTHMIGQHNGGCNGYAFGVNVTSPVKVTIQGNALVDTTLFMNQYYLDENKDGKPDYYLNFGPWWYESKSGAKRPNNGNAVTIVGGKLQPTNGLNVIIVYDINGKVWRDSTLIGKYYGGGWMRKNSPNDMVVNPFDADDFIMMNNGWHMGGMMADSVFARMLELNPSNIPNRNGEHIIKGYEFGMFDPNGTNNMWQGGGCGGQMNFNSMGSFQFHFDDKQVQAYGGDKNNMKVKYWDNQSNKWIVISNAVVNKTNNTVTFSSNQVSNYFILTSNSVTGVESNNNEIPVGYYLEQNYPNPFNPTTNISYSLPLAGNVVLKIYDIMGQEVKTLVSGFKEAGHYQITLDAGSFSSGVYLYRLQIGTFMTTKKFILMK